MSFSLPLSRRGRSGRLYPCSPHGPHSHRGHRSFSGVAGAGLRAAFTCAGLVLTAGAFTASAEDLLIAGFEDVSYGDWTATGTAFSAGPASGAALAALEITGQAGRGLACSENSGAGSGTGNDLPQGRLTSPPLVIQRKYLSFRIGGGDYERHCCLNLLADGQILKSATGRNSDTLYSASWDVSAWMGKTVRLELVDEASGSWGHLLVDQLVQTDTPEVLPVVTAPVYSEPLRPRFHFTARQWTMDRLNPGMRQEGWINDLNGMIYYEGEYHLFAQRWNKCWLHAVSRDLVHWEELPPAFWEQKLDSGVQSGHCVIDYQNTSGLGRPGAEPPMIAFWSHNDNLSHGISFSLDKGRTWQDHPGNPVLQFPERDPKVFRHEPSGQWVMMLYGSGQYHLFTSGNLLQWTRQDSAIPDAFECPDFFELPVEGRPDLKKWVLLHADGKYSLGTFDGRKFTEQTPRLLSDIGGGAFYAAQTFENTATGDGRRIQIAWMRGGPELFPGMPFAQQLSFPCRLTLQDTPEGLRLFRQPVAEIARLEGQARTWDGLEFKAGVPVTLAGSGEAYRLQAGIRDWKPGGVLRFDIRGTRVTLRQRSLRIEEHSGGQPLTQADLPQDVRDLEMLIDRRSLEIFVNEGQLSCTRNLLPAHSSLSVTVEDPESPVLGPLRLVPLKSMWPEAAP